VIVENHEGFWWSKHEPDLPKPIALDYKWKGRAAFLKALRNVEALIDADKPKNCRVRHYKGWSTCRICEQDNGSTEYVLEFMHSKWVWPVGFLHYVERHNVRPSQAFQEFIMAVDAASVILKTMEKVRNEKPISKAKG
jgi:hypothetical protein